MVTRSMDRIDSLIDELTNAENDDDGVIFEIIHRMERFSKSALYRRFFEKKAWSALRVFCKYYVQDKTIPDFPFDRLNRDIMVEWIEADEKRLLRMVITDPNVPFMVIREFYSDNENLLHVAAQNYGDGNEIFSMLLKNLPKDFLRIGLNAPDSPTEGKLPVERLFFDESGTFKYDEDNWIDIRRDIMPRLPELMFGILEEDVPLDEITNLLGSMNTVGRLITQVDNLALMEDLNSSQIAEYGMNVLYEFLDYFREQQQKIITLFENESSMKWLFKEKWNYVWNGNKWVEENDGFEPDINSLGDERNQEFWADEGCIWDEENKKWVEPDRFSNSRLSQQWFPRFGDEWSEGLRQWVKRNDFKPLYLTEPRHMIGAKDVVYDTVFDIERTIASVEFDRVLCEDGAANLANLKFVRIDVQYQGLNKDIEPFDMVLCNNKESFVKEIKRTGIGPTDVKVNVKVPQQREYTCSPNQLTYLKNGENCLWRSLLSGNAFTARYENEKMVVYNGPDGTALNHDFNAIEYFFVHFEMDRKFKIGQYYSPLEGDKGIIIEGFEQGEIRVSDFESGVPLQEFIRYIKPDEFSSKYNIYNTEHVAPQADIPKVGETWIHRSSGGEVTITHVSNYVEFSLGNSNRFYSLDAFRYLFQIKPEIGDEWIERSYSRTTPFSSRLLEDGWYDFFWEYKPAPPPQEVEDRNAKSINIGDMVNLPGYALPWKIVEVVGLKLRVKKLEPPKPNSTEETMLVDPQDVVFYYRPNLPDEIQLGQSYPTLKFRYDNLPTEENSLCMDIGSKVDCDIGEFTTTKFQPVKIMTDRGWEKDGEGILTVFCAKELKNWLNTPEVATELDMGGFERRNFDANSVRVYESNRLKEISPFTNNIIVAVEYMTQKEIDEQLALISEDKTDVQKEIEALESRISNLQRQIDNTPSERVKAFLQQQLNNARRTLMALRASVDSAVSGSGKWKSIKLRF